MNGNAQSGNADAQLELGKILLNGTYTGRDFGRAYDLLRRRENARVSMELDQERCYCAGLLHCLGDLALLRCISCTLLPSTKSGSNRIMPSSFGSMPFISRVT